MKNARDFNSNFHILKAGRHFKIIIINKTQQIKEFMNYYYLINKNPTGYNYKVRQHYYMSWRKQKTGNSNKVPPIIISSELFFKYLVNYQ